MGGIPIVGDLLAPTPEAPKTPAAAPPPPTEVDPQVIAARQRQRTRAASLIGSTSRTSSQGITGEASTTRKTLLGQ
jgi:hypothetical protein